MRDISNLSSATNLPSRDQAGQSAVRPLPELYVLRHGQTEWNRIGRMQGERDSSLTATGRAQAQAMGALLARLGVTPGTHRIYTSPKGRARSTAALAFGAGAPTVADPRLSEIGVGGWAGLTRAEIVAATPALSHATPMLAFYAAAPGGEPFAGLWARCESFLAGLDGPAVIVTHGITGRFLRTVATGRGPEALAELPGGQGVVFRISDGLHEVLRP